MCKRDLMREDGDIILYKSGKIYEYYILGHNDKVYMVYDKFREAMPFYITHEESSVPQLKYVFYTIEEYRQMQIDKLLS